MEQLICKSCGAPLEQDGHCSYCGARYKADYDKYGQKLYIETYTSPVKKLSCTTMIPRELAIRIGEEEMGKYAAEQIAHNMAKELGAMIRYTSSHECINDCVLIRGELRVVEPNFRF